MKFTKKQNKTRKTENLNLIKILAVFGIMIILFSNSALACIDQSTPFSFEVLLNKEGLDYNLEPLMNADNVILKTKEIPINPETGKELKIKEHRVYANGTEVKIYDDGTTEPQKTKTVTETIIYRSHHNKDIAVILSEVDDENLKGLSVKLQVPTEFAKTYYPLTTIDIRTKIKEGDNLLNIDEKFLKSLGYEVEVSGTGGEMEGIRSNLNKGNINIGINSIKVDYSKDYDEESDDPDDYRNYSEIHNSVDIKIKNENLTLELEEELKSVVLSLGISEEEWNNRIKNTEMVERIDTKALEKYVNSFDFKRAIKTELEWLRENKIISKIYDEDIKEISMLAEAGLAGYNSRIIWDDGWKSYRETNNTLLKEFNDNCGGITIGKMDLPKGEVGVLEVKEESQKDEIWWKNYLVIGIVMFGIILVFVLFIIWKIWKNKII